MGYLCLGFVYIRVIVIIRLLSHGCMGKLRDWWLRVWGFGMFCCRICILCCILRILREGLLWGRWRISFRIRISRHVLKKGEYSCLGHICSSPIYCSQCHSYQRHQHQKQSYHSPNISNSVPSFQTVSKNSLTPPPSPLPPFLHPNLLTKNSTSQKAQTGIRGTWTDRKFKVAVQ